ncbi:hypothetical protein [Roseibium sp. RKSG952]|uniref:hypothetical protein n=1 Tax=Roseibium sp. RKSG952 TaxID=2529384 RepID=UPI0012BCAD1B|nr:hypothetical protein [Roseibium sp. RKSG952]MTH96211.1 hypothetical protein [Roseibium sp. RKSG952]
MFFVEKRPNIAVRVFHACGVVSLVLTVITSVFITIYALMNPLIMAAMLGSVLMSLLFGLVTGMGFIAVAQIMYYLRMNHEILKDMAARQTPSA